MIAQTRQRLEPYTYIPGTVVGDLTIFCSKDRTVVLALSILHLAF